MRDRTHSFQVPLLPFHGFYFLVRVIFTRYKNEILYGCTPLQGNLNFERSGRATRLDCGRRAHAARRSSPSCEATHPSFLWNLMQHQQQFHPGPCSLHELFCHSRQKILGRYS
jgi:hypothetical protein